MNKDFQACNWFWDPIELELLAPVQWDSGERGRNWQRSGIKFKIIDGIWYFEQGFKWNGATGVPDGPESIDGPPVISSSGKVPITWFATMIHDAGCTGTYYEDFPYRRSEIDMFFQNLLIKINFKESKLYFIGVRFFGFFIGIWDKIRRHFDK